MASVGKIIGGKNVVFATNGKKSAGDGTGTDDYEQLDNKPSINGIVLQGNKTFDNLGVVPLSNMEILQILNRAAE